MHHDYERGGPIAQFDWWDRAALAFVFGSLLWVANLID
jgi:hypothetical protein